MPRSLTVRAAAIVSAVLLLVIGWYLGSPLFIRTTVFEDFPTPGQTAAIVAPPNASTSFVVSIGSAPVVIARGTLQYVDALHHGDGQVLLLRNGEERALRFENVAITNAPDVHVYLSRETGGTWNEGASLYLGPLKATDGSFNYEIAVGTDLGPYRSVVVWCRAFAVLVTWADLGPA
jgi:hypothetical protein